MKRFVTQYEVIQTGDLYYDENSEKIGPIVPDMVGKVAESYLTPYMREHVPPKPGDMPDEIMIVVKGEPVKFLANGYPYDCPMARKHPNSKVYIPASREGMWYASHELFLHTGNGDDPHDQIYEVAVLVPEWVLK